MALKQFNPTSPGRRFMTALTFDEITKDTPEKALTEPLKKTGGRDNRGRITVRFIGGGHKQRYRIVDFRRDKRGRPGQGRGHRVRPQPVGPPRPAALRGRREALHPLRPTGSRSARP